MNPPAPILLVDDSRADRFLTERALQRSRVANPVVAVEDGEAALDYLFQRNDFSDARRPLLVLLDLHMPGISGHDVLHAAKSNSTTRSIPIIMLTSSEDEQDVAAAYNEHANAYIVKPVDFDKLMNVMQTLGDFWVEIVHRNPD